MVDGHLISLMNEGGYLVNIARGPLVDEEALIKALKGGPLAGAGLVRAADAVRKVLEAVIGADFIDDRPFANLEEEWIS